MGLSENSRRYSWDSWNLKSPVYKLGERGAGLKNRSGRIQDFDQLKKECLASGSLFEDPEFPCTAESVWGPKDHKFPIEWMRPPEICRHPKLFVEGASRFDVVQGSVGNCWMVASAANLTLNDELFYRVVPEDQGFDSDYAGIFHFRIWKANRWIDVVVDDRLPTMDGALIFMKSRAGDEFWSALLEKAYAKMHGSYEALSGGSACEAMEDFTGGVTEQIDLKNPPKHLFLLMMKAYQRSSLMSCSIPEICRHPKLFVEGASRFDVVQGSVGNCWMVASAANLTLNDELFYRVVPEDQGFDSDYAGIFHFRIWKANRWIDVVVDDRLPTMDGALIFMKSRAGDEFWSALLEKAYAKMHGSYEALSGGSACEAMEDFTGGVTEQIDLKNPPKHLFLLMMKAYQRSSLMSCSIPVGSIPEEKLASGLVAGHAYSITAVRLVVPLVQVGGKRRRIVNEGDGLRKPVNSKSSVRQQMMLLLSVQRLVNEKHQG
ncbi:calpain-A isoform X6 [Ixodes scapularis]